MTSNAERAKKIVEWINLGVCSHQPATPRCADCMTAGVLEQLNEVVERAKAESYIQGQIDGTNREEIKWVERGYIAGYAAAKEQAAKITETGPEPGTGVYIHGDVTNTNDVIRGYLSWAADRIRAMKSEGER